MNKISSLSSVSNRSSCAQGQTGSARVTSREFRLQVTLMERETGKKSDDQKNRNFLIEVVF